MSNITNSNLFSGGTGLYGSIGDGYVPGHSLEVSGNGSLVEITTVNPDGVGLQIEQAPDGTNIWALIDEVSTDSRVFDAIWDADHIYRVRQLQPSVGLVEVYVQNNIDRSAGPSTSGGFITASNTGLITLDRIYTLPPLP